MKNNDNYNSFSLFQFIWKWRYWLLAICLITAVLSFCCSLFIKPKYKSNAVIYAPRTNSVAKILLNEEGYNERLDIKAYAIEEETEQMMQLLAAREIKDSLIKKYDLANYYGLNTNNKGWQNKLYKIVTANLIIKRTNFGAINISVSDWDPQRASDMANDVLRLVDTIKNRAERERAVAAYQALQAHIDSVENASRCIKDSIRMCMENGVFDYESQSERVMQQYAIAVAQGNAAAANRLSEELKKLETWGPKYMEWSNLQENFSKYEALCRQKMLDAQMDMSDCMPVKFVVERPIPADKKYYPKKSIITLVSTLSVLILSIIVLLMIEKLDEKPSTKTEESAE